MAPPIKVKVRSFVACCGGWVGYIWIVCADRRSVEVLLLTGTLVLTVFPCRLGQPVTHNETTAGLVWLQCTFTVVGWRPATV